MPSENTSPDEQRGEWSWPQARPEDVKHDPRYDRGRLHRALREAGSILAALLVMGAPFIAVVLRDRLLVADFSAAQLAPVLASFLTDIATAVFGICGLAWFFLTVYWIFSPAVRGRRPFEPYEGMMVYPAFGLYLWALAPTVAAIFTGIGSG